MLKIVTHKLSGKTGRVAYEMFICSTYFHETEVCVFTGLDRSGPSTLNSAERIVEEIAKEENINLTDFYFFDLLTCTGYADKKPGEYELLRLQLEFEDTENTKLSNVGWVAVVCPYQIKPIFAKYIEGNAA